MGDKVEVRKKTAISRCPRSPTPAREVGIRRCPHESAPDNGTAHSVTDTSVAPSGAGMIEPRADIIVFVLRCSSITAHLSSLSWFYLQAFIYDLRRALIEQRSAPRRVCGWRRQTSIRSSRRALNSITTERGRPPSGHSGWLSAQTIAFPGLAGSVGLEGRTFFE